MDDKNFQITSDAAAVEHVAKVKSELGGGGPSVQIKMHSGIVYSGIASGGYFGETSGSNQPRSVGGYILLATPGRRLRLDALDIKSWTIGAT